MLQRLGDPDLRIADVRWYLGQPSAAAANTGQGTCPGAVFVDLDADLADHRPDAGRHPLPDPRAFARRLEARWDRLRHHVVAYDDLREPWPRACGGCSTTWGTPQVSVLDGGLAAWTGPITTEVPTYPPARLSLGTGGPARSTARPGRRLDELTLLDVRAPERYRGETEPVDPVAGHIPGARNAPVAGNTGPDADSSCP